MESISEVEKRKKEKEEEREEKDRILARCLFFWSEAAQAHTAPSCSNRPIQWATTEYHWPLPSHPSLSATYYLQLVGFLILSFCSSDFFFCPALSAIVQEIHPLAHHLLQTSLQDNPYQSPSKKQANKQSLTHSITKSLLICVTPLSKYRISDEYDLYSSKTISLNSSATKDPFCSIHWNMKIPLTGTLCSILLRNFFK